MKKITFPELNNYSDDLNPITNSDRLKKSIKGMLTLFNRPEISISIGQDEFIDDETEDYGEATLKIEKHIGGLIQEYCKNKSDKKLVDIFHYIQLWGGITGRSIYVRNGGFGNNFKLDNYKAIVEKIIDLKKASLETGLKEIEKLFISIPFIGVAYGTKHLRFWSINTNKNSIQLPILDRVISNGLLDTPYCAWRQYYTYVKQMQEEAEKRNVSITALERTLYNKFNEQ
jgi:hypothetical protein